MRPRKVRRFASSLATFISDEVPLASLHVGLASARSWANPRPWFAVRILAIAHTAASSVHGSKSWLTILAACLGIAVATYNTTAIMTALPAIRSSLDIDAQTVQWIVNIYMLSAAVMMAAMGRFADIFGKLRMYLIGVGTFAAGSIVIIFAGDAVVMLAGRTLQGIGTAGIVSTSAALISVATPEEKRSQALGLWAGGAALGFALGPLIGGTLTDLVSWRVIFVVDIPLLAIAALVCLLIGRSGIAAARSETETTVDYLGLLLLVVTLGTFVYGLTSGVEAGWMSLQTLALFTVAALGGIAFAVWEHRAIEPLVNFGFFTQNRYVAGTLGMFLTGMLMTGALYYTNLFVQTPGALHFTALQAGLAMLPFTLTMFVTSLAAPRLLGSLSFRWPVTIGMLALAAGYWLMQNTTNQTAYADLYGALMILGFGSGLCYALLPRVGLRGLPDESAGQGSGVINTCYFIGLAIGTAAGSLVAAHIKRVLVVPVISQLMPEASDRVSLDLVLVHGSQSQIDHALARVPPDIAHKLRVAMQEVSDNAFDGVMELMTVVALIGAALCVLLIRGERT